MLYYKDTNKPWKGQRINGISHPLSIAKIWSDEELDAIGLKRVFPVAKAPKEPTLDEVKERHLAMVDVDAETALAEGFATTSARAVLYREKFEQAQAIQAMDEEAVAQLSRDDLKHNFPTLAASIGIDGDDILEVANLIVDKYEQWANGTYAIERSRLAAKKAIREANTIPEVHSAYASLTWD